MSSVLPSCLGHCFIRATERKLGHGKEPLPSEAPESCMHAFINSFFHSETLCEGCAHGMCRGWMTIVGVSRLLPTREHERPHSGHQTWAQVSLPMNHVAGPITCFLCHICAHYPSILISALLNMQTWENLTVRTQDL